MLHLSAARAWLIALMIAAVGAGGLVGSAAAATQPAAGSDYHPVTDGYPQATCFWFGPMGQMHPRTNLAYPDEGAWYWGARFRLPEGSTLTFRADFPHARFMSFNAYLDQAATDSKEDRDIVPWKRSTNPYLVGADRYAKHRAYRVTVAGPGVTLPKSSPNILKLPRGNQVGSVQELIYRVYLPDRTRDRAPASLPEPRLRLADGQVLRGDRLCSAINDNERFFTFQVLPVPVLRSFANTPGADPVTNPARSPLRWEKFFNTPLALSIYRYGTPSQDRRIADQRLGPVGGYYDNKAVSYTVGPISRKLGQVLVLRGKLPTTPRTGNDVHIMRGGQVRYWSICQNMSPSQTNVVACVADAQIRKALRGDRRYVIAVSTRADRPKNARRACHVSWLNWGTELDPLGLPSGTLIMRNLVARRSFAQAIQRVGINDISVTTHGHRNERQIMGAYSPSGRYLSKRAFEHRGCR